MKLSRKSAFLYHFDALEDPRMDRKKLFHSRNFIDCAVRQHLWGSKLARFCYVWRRKVRLPTTIFVRNNVDTSKTILSIIFDDEKSSFHLFFHNLNQVGCIGSIFTKSTYFFLFALLVLYLFIALFLFKIRAVFG